MRAMTCNFPGSFPRHAGAGNWNHANSLVTALELGELMGGIAHRGE